MLIKDLLEINKKNIIDEYLSGISTCELGRRFNCANSYIHIKLKEWGIELRKFPSKVNNCENINNVLKLNNEGKTAYRIARILNLTEQTVQRILKKNGIDISWRSSCHKVPLPQEQIIEDYLTGMGCYKLSKKYNATESYILRILRKHNIKIRPLRRYCVNEDFFEKIDTQEKAYVLGFFAGDGCNEKNGEIRFAITDLELLEKIKIAMQFEGPIHKRIRNNPKHKPQYTLSIGCRKMSNDLINLGFPPNKTYIATLPEENLLPKNLMRHFLRGLIDADGCITSDRSKFHNWQVFITGVITLLKPISNFYSDLDIDWRFRDCPQAVDIIKSLVIQKIHSVKKILDLIYSDATIYLERKFQRYQEFLTYYNTKFPIGVFN